MFVEWYKLQIYTADTADATAYMNLMNKINVFENLVRFSVRFVCEGAKTKINCNEINNNSQKTSTHNTKMKMKEKKKLAFYTRMETWKHENTITLC